MLLIFLTKHMSFTIDEKVKMLGSESFIWWLVVEHSFLHIILVRTIWRCWGIRQVGVYGVEEEVYGVEGCIKAGKGLWREESRHGVELRGGKGSMWVCTYTDPRASEGLWGGGWGVNMRCGPTGD